MLKEFIYTSSTDLLRSAVDKKYRKLGKNAKGVVLCLCLILCEIFQMFKEVKLVMLTFIEFFKKNRIAKYDGENILLAAEQFLGVCKRRDAVGALTEEEGEGWGGLEVVPVYAPPSAGRHRRTYRDP